MSGSTMEERFMDAGAVEPPARRRPASNPRRWPWWARPPALFAAAAAASAGGGLLVSAWKGYDPTTGAAWGLYAGGVALLAVGVAPFLGDSGSATWDGFADDAREYRHARLAGAASLLAYLVFGAALIALGVVVELYA